jgi:hypothetical protein
MVSVFLKPYLASRSKKVLFTIRSNSDFLITLLLKTILGRETNQPQQRGGRLSGSRDDYYQLITISFILQSMWNDLEFLKTFT